MTQTITGKRRQAALGFIFVTALMDVISLGS
jgi:DHA1 family tetracycline resistance protein-like MFS transporter